MPPFTHAGIMTRVNRCAIMEGHLITKKIVAIALRGFQANVAKKVSLTYKMIFTKNFSFSVLKDSRISLKTNYGSAA